MSDDYAANSGVNPVSTGGMGGSTEVSAAAIVIGAVVALCLIARGFRGVNVGGVRVGVN